MRALRLGVVALLGLSGWAAGAVVVAAPAYASACANGATCPPDPLSVGPGATLLASTSGTQTASGSFTADYTEYVYADKSNVYCNGCLDFVIQVNNQPGSADALERVGTRNFQGYRADIGFATNQPPGAVAPGTVSPNAVERNTSGTSLFWDFKAPGQINAGQGSVLLVAETDATQFVAGLVSIQDGGAAQGPGFQPSGQPQTPPVNLPEAPFVPALGLFGGVVLGWFGLRRRGPSGTA